MLQPLAEYNILDIKIVGQDMNTIFGLHVTLGGFTLKKILFAMGLWALLCFHTNASSMPDSYQIGDVPIVSQYPELPTGCEATSLSMLLNYFDEPFTKTQVADMIPKAPLPSYNDGILTGPSPSNAFIGTPYSSHSYGIYHEPLVTLLDQTLPGRALNLSGQTFDSILETVAKDQPVMIWASINLVPLSYTVSWTLDDASTFTWPSNEHAMVVTGYTPDSIIVNDPYSGTQRKYNKNLLKARWEEMGKQAITLIPEPRSDHSIIKYFKRSAHTTPVIRTGPQPIHQPEPAWDEDLRLDGITPNDSEVKEELIEDTLIEATPSSLASSLSHFIEKGDTASLAYYENVIRFQAEQNITVDGILGEQTKKKLENPQLNARKDVLPGALSNSNYAIVVNKTKHILTVYKKGEVHKRYPVAVGKPSTPTPNYKFKIVNKTVNPTWNGMGGRYQPVKGGSPSNPLGTRWMGLSTDRYRGYGIHGNSTPRSIGNEVSSGCIRMINADAEELYSYIPMSTPVYVGTEDILSSWGITQ